MLVKQVYYRLQQVDFDQSYVYTDIKVVSFEQKKLLLELSPNPTSGQLTIKNGIGKVTITNALGQVVQSFEINEQLYDLDVSDLASGQYVFALEQKGGNVETVVFVR